MDSKAVMNFLRNIGEGTSGGLTTYASALPIWAGRKASKEYGDITLEQALQLAREHNRAMNAESPIAATVGGIAGTAMPLGLVSGTGVKGILKTAAATGALSGSQAMSQTGDPADAALGTAIGTVAGLGGAALNKALPIIGSYVKNAAAARMTATDTANTVAAGAKDTGTAVMDFIKGLPAAAGKGAVMGATAAATTGQDPLKGAALGALGGMTVLKAGAAKEIAKSVAIPLAETTRTNWALVRAVKGAVKAAPAIQSAPTTIASEIGTKNMLNENGTFPVNQQSIQEPDEFEQYRAKPASQQAPQAQPVSAPEEDEFAQYRAK